MQVLLVDHETSMLEQLARALRDLCTITIATTKERCLERLRAEEYDAVIVCDELADGTGIDLLALMTQRHPAVLRIFAAPPRKLMQLHGRLGPFRLFQLMRYPFTTADLKALLKSVQAAQEANADTTNVQHIVLQSAPGDEPVEAAPATQATAAKASAGGAPPIKREIVQPNVVQPIFILPDISKVDLGLELAPEWHPGTLELPQQPPQQQKDSTGTHRQLTIPWSARSGAPQPQTVRNTPTSNRSGASPEPTTPKNVPLQLSPKAQRAVIVFTRDKACLDVTIAALAGRSVSVVHANDEEAVIKTLKTQGALSVLVDMGATAGTSKRFLERICAAAGGTRVLVVGRATDSSHIAPLLANGMLHHFLVKPLSRSTTRAAFESVLAPTARDSFGNGEHTVPFASLIDRVAATDLRRSLDTLPLHLKVLRVALKNWEWFMLAGIALGVVAMLALAYLLSSHYS